jgi:transposase-like protein
MELLSVKKVSELLGVNETTVRAWVRRGLLNVDENLWNRGRGKMMITPEALFSPRLPACPKADVLGLGRLQRERYLALRAA